MKYYSFIAVALASVLLLTTELAIAHSGGTNSSGCHTNRKTGDYHCHNKKPRHAREITYCHIYDGEARCGYAFTSCEDLRDQFGGSCTLD